MQVWFFLFLFFETEQARPCLLKVKHITQSLGSEAGQISMSSEMALYEIPIFSYQGPETMHTSKEQAWLFKDSCAFWSCLPRIKWKCNHGKAAHLSAFAHFH